MISKRATYFIQKKSTELKPKQEMENLIHTHTHNSQFNNRRWPRLQILASELVDHEVIPLLGRLQSSSKICRLWGTPPHYIHYLLFYTPVLQLLHSQSLCWDHYLSSKMEIWDWSLFLSCLLTDSSPLEIQMYRRSKSLFLWPHQLSSELCILLSWPSPVLYSDIQVAFSRVNLVLTCWELFFIITMSLKIKPKFYSRCLAEVFLIWCCHLLLTVFDNSAISFYFFCLESVPFFLDFIIQKCVGRSLLCS